MATIGETVVVVPLETVAADSPEGAVSAVSWGAILAGGVASAAVTIILVAFGAGMGLSAISPWSAAATSTTFKVGSGVYLIVTAMIASGIGGYLAGRLRRRWLATHSREVFFRDTAHGFIAWGFATLLSAAVLTSTTTALVSGASNAAMHVVGQSPGMLDGFVDSLVRPDPASANSSAEASAARAEIGRIFAASLQNGGTLTQDDTTYAARIVAARTGVPQAQAEERVNSAIAGARDTIDRARKAAAQLALWITASLLVGAFSASLAAIEGGGLRDGTWHYKV